MTRILFRRWATLAAALVLTGCTVGPDFHPPQAPAQQSYTANPLPKQTVSAATTGGGTQHFALAEDLTAQWWTLFRSPQLDALVRQGLQASPTLKAASAALRVAEENYRAAGGALLYPSVDAAAHLSRQRAPNGSSPASIYNLYNASVSVAYTFDLFGGARRQIEGLQAQVDYQRYQYEAAFLTLSSNIVTSAVQEASLRAQIAATDEILAAEQKQLQLVERQFELGAVPRSSVLAQQAQLARTRATRPPLEKQLAVVRHALAALTGQFPGSANLPEFRLDALHLPEQLPVSLPSALARQRPDLQAAEALLHQASAAVGVATANLYPQVTLSGSFGTQALHAKDLFGSQSLAWNLGTGLLQPLFHGGELEAKKRAARAAYEEALARYRQTVLTAFQNVADVLRSLETDARTLQAQAAAEQAARETLALTHRQFELGAVGYPQLLIAERDAQQARLSLVTAQAARYADSAALFQALGGGWWNRDEASPATAEPTAN